MKKLFFVVALLAVVASCTKNEVIPQNDGNKEITYHTAPLTKAHSSFETSNKFYSYAYLLTSGNWASSSNSSKTRVWPTESLMLHQLLHLVCSLEEVSSICLVKVSIISAIQDMIWVIIHWDIHCLVSHSS